MLNHMHGAKHPETADSIQTCRNILANSSSNLISKFGNATQQDVTVLKFLQNRTDLVIKRADKSGAVVVWRSDHYSEEPLRLFSVPDFYKPLFPNSSAAYQDKITATVKLPIESNSLPPASNRLIVSHPHAASFYILSKIYKAGSPGRPVVSTISCPTSLLAFLAIRSFGILYKTCPDTLKTQQTSSNPCLIWHQLTTLPSSQ